MARVDTPRIAVLGGGPIGLEAALYACALNLPVTVFERGRIGEHLLHWGHVRLFSPFGMNSTLLGRAVLASEKLSTELPREDEYLTGRQHHAAYLAALAQSAKLKECIKTDTQVLMVGRRGFLKGESVSDGRRARQPFLLLLRESKKVERIEEADIVLDCTGTYAQHRWLGEGGMPAIGELQAGSVIAYGLEDVLGERKPVYANKTVLVLGAGYSAATTVSNLATLAEDNPETWVIWLSRDAGTQPLKRIANDPLRERDKLAVRGNTLATRPDGNVEFHNQTVIDSVEFFGADKGFRLGSRSAGKARTWEVDRVIANVGYTPDTNLYRELQIHECYASLGPMNLAAALAKHAGSDCLAIPAQGPDTVRNPEPGFYILGAKSYGRNSHFLLRTGFEQIREVFRLITGKADLDLYKKS
jgi:thioredoxin reductase